MTFPGPCCVCGGRDFELSCGGPTICPQFDTGNFTQATVFRQAKEMRRLREQIERFAKAIEFGDEAFDGDDWAALIKEAETIAHQQVATEGK